MFSPQSRWIAPVFFVISAFVSSCGITDDNADDDTAPDEVLEQTSLTSGCGGFYYEANMMECQEGYCDNELIIWEYDDNSNSLTVTDQRVFLNCCGRHSMTIEEVDEHQYAITELDEVVDTRCICECFFDYTVVAQDISAGILTLSIERVVTDWPEGSGLVWSGEIDTSEGGGTITLEELVTGDNERYSEECLSNCP